MHRFSRLALIAGFVTIVSLSTGPCPADVRLPHVFGDHMVLQRDLPVRIWGTAEPGESVTVSIGENTASTAANAEGHWKIELPSLEAGKPVAIKVVGKNAITLQDVLVGEVWVCSGQSNMQMSVAQSTNGKE
jgi:sialate O-acetylesterase